MHFLLVHGTTQTPVGWQLLTGELAALGHSTSTTDLAAFGSDLTAMGYAAAVQAEHAGEPAPAVVGHSGAGLLVPAIAEAMGAALQVFLAAYVPSGSRSLMSELEADPTGMMHPDWIGVDPGIDHDAARRFLFHDCTPDMSEWAIGTLRTFAPRSLYSEVVPVAPGIPAISIVPDGDRTLRPEWMISATRERLGVEPHIIDGGHCPHVSRPATVAAILDSAAG